MMIRLQTLISHSTCAAISRRTRRGRAGRCTSSSLSTPRGMGLHSSTSQLDLSTFCGIRWVPSVDSLVITRHKLDTNRLTYQNGSGEVERWASVRPCRAVGRRVPHRRPGPRRGGGGCLGHSRDLVVHAAAMEPLQRRAAAQLRRVEHGTGVLENKHATDVESTPPPPYTPRACLSSYTEAKLCSDLSRVLVLNDPPPRCTPPRAASARC